MANDEPIANDKLNVCRYMVNTIQVYFIYLYASSEQVMLRGNGPNMVMDSSLKYGIRSKSCYEGTI